MASIILPFDLPGTNISPVNLVWLSIYRDSLPGTMPSIWLPVVSVGTLTKLGLSALSTAAPSGIWMSSLPSCCGSKMMVKVYAVLSVLPGLGVGGPKSVISEMPGSCSIAEPVRIISLVESNPDTGSLNTTLNTIGLLFMVIRVGGSGLSVDMVTVGLDLSNVNVYGVSTAVLPLSA